MKKPAAPKEVEEKKEGIEKKPVDKKQEKAL